MPYKNFKRNTTIAENDIINYDERSNKGYILKVDLEYPKELHDLHRDYPLLPESRQINENEVSEVKKYIKFIQVKMFKMATVKSLYWILMINIIMWFIYQI